MCGLAGYIDFNNANERSNRVMLEMLRLQQHRGPDDSGIVAVNTHDQQLWEVDSKHPADFENPANLVLGFNRLSILDLTTNGHQPMISVEAKVVILLNGEVYNAFDYKDDLINKDYVFKSQTDTEVVLNLYLEYGFEKMIKMLNGMFAIVLLDLRKGILFLARDRFGIKPLYVLQTANRLAFSSELKSFKALPDFHFELEKDNLDEFLLFRNLINRTLFKNIINLPPGEYWHTSFTGRLIKTKYYDVADENHAVLAGEQAKYALIDSLQEGVHRQMISDVKLGCQLSGGVDSSMVSYYAANYLPAGNLDTISIVFENQAYSEKQYIDYVANRLKLKSHKFTLQPGYYIDKLEDATWHFENPLNHPNTIGIFLLSSEAKKHVTVLLSGEGADEILAGYERFSWQQEGIFSKHFIVKLRQNREAFMQFIKSYIDADTRMVMSSVFSSLPVIHNLRPGFNFTQAIIPRLDISRSIGGSGLSKHRKYEIKTYLPDLLMRQDKMSMAHSIENRVPFLDNDLVSTALNIDEASLINKYRGNKEGKFVLKETCAEVFDNTFAFRKKMGFGIPLREFMQSPIFKEKMSDVWLPGIRQRGIFPGDPINNWARNMSRLPADKIDGLWQMIGFEIWAQQYLDN
jgi:asparagine synthase (glutamine-hydrolysing)